MRQIPISISDDDRTYPDMPDAKPADDKNSLIVSMSWQALEESKVKEPKNQAVLKESIAGNFGRCNMEDVEIIDTAHSLTAGCCKIVFRIRFAIEQVEDFENALKYVNLPSFCEGVTSKIQQISERDYNRDLFDASVRKATGLDLAKEFQAVGANVGEDRAKTTELSVHCLPNPVLADSDLLGQVMSVMEREVCSLKFESWAVKGPSVAVTLAEPMECCQVLGFQSLLSSFLCDMAEDTAYSSGIREHLSIASEQVELIPMSANRVDPSKLTFEECLDWFERYDTSGDGSLTTDELDFMFQEMSFPGGKTAAEENFGGGIGRTISVGKYEFASWFHGMHRTPGATPRE